MPAQTRIMSRRHVVELASGIAIAVIGAVVMVAALMCLLTAREINRTSNLEAQLTSRQEGTAESACGPRPQVNYWTPYHTKARYQAYNYCLAHLLARPNFLSSFFTLVPMVIVLVLVAVTWFRTKTSLPSSAIEQSRACARVGDNEEHIHYEFGPSAAETQDEDSVLPLEEVRYDMKMNEDDVRVRLHLQVDQCDCQGECVPSTEDMALLHARYFSQIPANSESAQDIKEAITNITKKFFTEKGMSL
ncbi:hypothetical protein Pcinc_038461 [Petrolisthes cinctipes]|uniref:Uncharacterized protein n=1 Tax=Petrolisthes cinctipes TaxID=88211 RepID=A0AAE1BTP4_PETCI|nr:hypothetical protein Pcinc_038461 [Petrolisthes cinctipes]